MKNINKRIKDENGAVMVVESAVVFPVVFFVVIVLLYFGNVLYQQSKVDSITVRTAEYLAAHYTNPMLRHTVLPTDSNDVELNPYRYLFGDGQAKEMADTYIKNQLDDVGTGLYKGMEITYNVRYCDIDNDFIYQQAKVIVDYELNFYPFALFHFPTIRRSTVATSTGAVDADEFVRNIDMVMDYSDTLGLTKMIKDTLGKFTN